jgi:hypothetical protein
MLFPEDFGERSENLGCKPGCRRGAGGGGGGGGGGSPSPPPPPPPPPPPLRISSKLPAFRKNLPKSFHTTIPGL